MVVLRCLCWVAAFFVSSSCHPQATSKSEATPTATEIFDLRSKCAVLGRQILQNSLFGPALAQDAISHYNPETNRCYVKLSVHSADPQTPLEDRISDEYLYDGQTQEMLAAATDEEGKKSASVLSRSLDGFIHSPEIPTYDEVRTLIGDFMAEERKP